MKLIILYFIIILSTTCSYAHKCAHARDDEYGENSDDLTRNLTVLLYRSLPIYSINMQQAFNDTQNKIVSKKYKSTATYNHFLDKSKPRILWTPLLAVAHEFGHTITIQKNWFNHLLQPWDKDLKVDYLSGYILGKLGASMEDCQETFIAMFNHVPLTDDQNNTRRLNALIAGHFRASYNF